MLAAVRLVLVVVVALVVQTTWLADARPFGVPGDLLLLVSIAGGLTAGSRRGAVIGFVSGLALDLVLLSPFGLSALVYLGVGYGAGRVNARTARSVIWIPVATSLIATIGGILAYVAMGRLLGQSFRLTDLPRMLALTSLMNAALILPGLRVLRWVEGGASSHAGPIAARDSWSYR